MSTSPLEILPILLHTRLHPALHPTHSPFRRSALSVTWDFSWILDIVPTITLPLLPKKARGIFIYLKRSSSTLVPSIFLPLYTALIRSHLEFAVQASSPFCPELPGAWKCSYTYSEVCKGAAPCSIWDSPSAAAAYWICANMFLRVCPILSTVTSTGKQIKASGSTRIGSLDWESRSWLKIETKLCVCCVESVHIYTVSRYRKK